MNSRTTIDKILLIAGEHSKNQTFGYLKEVPLPVLNARLIFPIFITQELNLTK